MTLDGRYERGLGSGIIAGVDEVGRGPWAGPVLAAAVILDPQNVPVGLNDSKKLSRKRREELHQVLMAHAICSVGEANVEEIDQFNILQASLLAMKRAVEGLSRTPDLVLVDGNRLPRNLPCAAQAIVGGDRKVASIAAASIVAKVTRDRIMGKLAQSHPGYGWETNAGYGTQAHRMGLFCHGVTPHHRGTFKPIHNMLMNTKPVTR